jgi:hypothetical protein
LILMLFHIQLCDAPTPLTYSSGFQNVPEEPSLMVLLGFSWAQ